MKVKMNKFSAMLIVIIVHQIISSSMFAQSPEKISYQAVIRNTSNQLVTNHAIGMKISILQGSISGTEVYAETQNPTSNINGLVSIEIGGGTWVSGNFETINWANGPYFIKTEIDPEGGNIYTIIGTSQLLSVAYALHAKTVSDYSETDPVFEASVASGITAGDTSNWNNKLDSYSETDPVFGASIASGITTGDTSNWNNKLGSYTETDPLFGASIASGITTGDTSNWNNKLGSYTETDPVFGVWDKSTGITITESQITDLGSYIENESDPAVSANFDFTGAANGDILKYYGTKFVKYTPDYAASAHLHNNATTSTDGFMSSIDKTKLNNLENVNIMAGTNISVSGTYPNITISETTKHYIGELYGGGVVFWVDHTGQHGLIVSMIDLSTNQAWSNLTSSLIGNTSYWNGFANTTAIIGQSGHTNSAAKLCDNYTNADYGTGIYSDWYLPSKCELIDLWSNLKAVLKAIDNDGNPATTVITSNNYWTSTEFSSTTAWYFDFITGTTHLDGGKGGLGYVRAIRAF